VLGGVLSFALEILIALELPGSAAWAIGLVVGVDLIFDLLRAVQGDQRVLHPEQARLDRRPLRLAGVAVHEHVLDRADLVAAGVDGLHALPRLGVLERCHRYLPDWDPCLLRH